MELFARTELILKKKIKPGDEESLLALFNASERFKPMEVLIDAEEDEIVKVALEGLGEVDLKLGNDMEKGRRKTIMTLFWYSERSKPIKIQGAAEAKDKITITISKY